MINENQRIFSLVQKEREGGGGRGVDEKCKLKYENKMINIK